MKTCPSSLVSIRSHHVREEMKAFEAYANALRDWERARDCVDHLGVDLQTALAELQQKTIEGRAPKALADVRRTCRRIQEDVRNWQRAASKAKAEASRRFTALILARNARAEFERCAVEVEVEKVVIAPALRVARDFQMSSFQWN